MLKQGRNFYHYEEFNKQIKRKVRTFLQLSLRRVSPNNLSVATTVCIPCSSYLNVNLPIKEEV